MSLQEQQMSLQIGIKTSYTSVDLCVEKLNVSCDLDLNNYRKIVEILFNLLSSFKCSNLRKGSQILFYFYLNS